MYCKGPRTKYNRTVGYNLFLGEIYVVQYKTFLLVLQFVALVMDS
jgi:hypothetical protein